MEEVICISSDEEVIPRKASDNSVTYKKEEIVEDDSNKPIDDRKRKILHTDENPEKKAKLSKNIGNAVDDIPKCTDLKLIQEQTKLLTFTNGYDSAKELNKALNKDDCSKVTEGKKCDSSNSSSQKLLTTIPQLVIKKKVSLYNANSAEEDLFEIFLNLCLKKDSSTDMKKIITKLKKRYEQLNPSYVKSECFTRLLMRKRDCISNDGRNIYVHIGDIMDEMKARVRKDLCGIAKNIANENDRDISEMASENSEALPSTTNVDEADVMESDADIRNIHHINKTLRLLDITMRRCRKRIKKLKESEVDFDDDKDSNYIKLERYQRRMVDLYNKYCEISGENPDAGRPYLRPKHLNVTPLPQLNHAITSFVNSKISKRNKLTKGSSFTDALIFPDYADILNCIEKCNTQQNLGLDSKTRDNMAKKAFHDLGEYLQRVRQHDYWDTFSLYLENEDDDPALKDEELASKLQHNQKLGEKKLTEVFQEYVMKEELLKLQSADDADENREENEEDDEEEDDEEEDDEEDEEEEGEEEEEEEEQEQEGKEKDKKSNNMQEGNNTIKNILSEVNEIKNQDKRTDENKASADHNSVMDQDDCAIVVVNDTEKVESNDIFEVIETNVSEVTSMTRVSTITCTTISEIEVNEDKNSSMDAEINDQKEQEKPLLRVRSFAKPPGHWKDSQEVIDKPNVSETPKKDAAFMIDLTNEKTKQDGISLIRTFSVNKGALQTPLKGKYKTVMVPGMLGGKKIIRVQNLTNNRTVKLKNQDQPSSSGSVYQDSCSKIHTSTIISPSSKPATRVFQQIQHTNSPTKSVREIPLKNKWTNKTIVHLIPSKTIYMPTKSLEQNRQTSHNTSDVPATK